MGECFSLAAIPDTLTIAVKHHQAGNLEVAERLYQEVLQVQPDQIDALHLLGVVCHETGRREMAIELITTALRLRPDFPEGHYNLGKVLQEQGKLAEAIASYQRALRFKPDYAEAYYNLANALRDCGRLDESLTSYRQAIRVKPGYAKAYTNLGSVLLREGRPDEATKSFKTALRLQPQSADCHGNLASALRQLGKLEEAVAHSRYAAVLKGRFACQVVARCPKALLPLLRSCPGIDQLLELGSPLPAFDVYAPLMSVPGILRTTLATVPARVPYLFADAELVERWRAELNSTAGLKIGIVWQGNPRYPSDRFRSVPLTCFEPLARLEGVRLFSLQKGAGIEQLSTVAERFPITDLGHRLDGAAGAFMDTVAVMQNLDLVVAPDMAVAHLAGALGVRVWIPLSFVPDWRWLLQRADSPWYPSARLFRQRAPADWTGVFEEIETALRQHLQARSPGH